MFCDDVVDVGVGFVVDCMAEELGVIIVGVTLVSVGVKLTSSPVSSLITSSAIFSIGFPSPKYLTETIPAIATIATIMIKMICRFMESVLRLVHLEQRLDLLLHLLAQ